jgi:hypothetical protein
MGYRNELDAMSAVGEVMEKLDAAERARVLRWIIDSFGIDSVRLGKAPSEISAAAPSVDGHPHAPMTTGDFGTLAELLDAANPSTSYERILAICCWLQETQGQPDIVAQKVNEELKHQGHAIANITDAFTKLMRKVPAPIRQTRKEGTSAQARKRYALTEAGKRQVLELIRRNRGGGSPDSAAS